MILENETLPLDQPVNFIEMLYPQNPHLLKFVHKFRLASRVGFDDDQWLEEELYMLLKTMLEVHRKIGKEIHKIPQQRGQPALKCLKELIMPRNTLMIIFQVK